MATRSKFERQLSPGLRRIGFSIKIPDVGIGHKPFDYIVGIPRTDGSLGFVAIEAKKAVGWTLNKSSWRAHQRNALDIISKMSPMAAWVAIGFLDIPKMKLDYNRKPIGARRKAEAYMIQWQTYKEIEGKVSISYSDIVNCCSSCTLLLARNNSRRMWEIPSGHPILSQHH